MSSDAAFPSGAPVPSRAIPTTVTTGAAVAVPPPDAPKSFARQAFEDTFKSSRARAGSLWIAILVLFAVFAPFLANTHPLLMHSRGGGWSSPLIAAMTQTDVSLLTIFFAAVALLFLLPTDLRARRFTLAADDFRQVDWGTVLMFGAALSLGGLMVRTGLAEAVGRAAFEVLGTHDPWLLTAVAVAAAILLSEVTSNTATAAALMPVVHRLCVGAGVDPVPPLLGVALGASFGSALPVSTPPNAIVYGTGLAPVRRMIPGGPGLDLVAGLVIWAGLWVAMRLLAWSPLTG